MAKFDPQSFDASWIYGKEGITVNCMKYIEQMGMYLCDKENEVDPCLLNFQDKRPDKPGWNAVTTSQLRNIFEAVKHIQIKFDMDPDNFDVVRPDILLLRPKIAYQAARVSSKNAKSNINGFCLFAKKAIDAIMDSSKKDENIMYNRYKRFSQIMEGIIAYHKVYGGKD